MPIVEGELKRSIAFSSKSRGAWQKRNPFPGAAGVASDPSEAFQQIDYTSRTAAGGISEQSIRGKLLWNATSAIDVTLERSEEHTSELQSLMRTSYAVFCLKKKKKNHTHQTKH